MTKRVTKIEGYTLYPASRPGYKSIMVLSSDNTVVDFEDLNCAQYPVLIRALEADESVTAYVVSDHKGIQEF